MAIPADPFRYLDYTPVLASRGRRVHAVSLLVSSETACGREFTGWQVVARKMNCRHCKLAILKGRVRR
jgi:hypothetical protein